MPSLQSSVNDFPECSQNIMHMQWHFPIIPWLLALTLCKQCGTEWALKSKTKLQYSQCCVPRSEPAPAVRPYPHTVCGERNRQCTQSPVTPRCSPSLQVAEFQAWLAGWLAVVVLGKCSQSPGQPLSQPVFSCCPFNDVHLAYLFLFPALCPYLSLSLTIFVFSISFLSPLFIAVSQLFMPAKFLIRDVSLPLT